MTHMGHTVERNIHPDSMTVYAIPESRGVGHSKTVAS